MVADKTADDPHSAAVNRDPCVRNRSGHVVYTSPSVLFRIIDIDSSGGAQMKTTGDTFVTVESTERV
jgi:hypothetical protein